MADEGFKFIAVTAADEDDEVITAGVRPAVEAGAAEPDGAKAGVVQGQAKDLAKDRAAIGDGSSGEAQVVGDDGGASEAPEVPEALGVHASADAPVKPAARKPAGQSARKREEYRETTLSDLEPQPMSTTQKAVIIAAVVCIIGALVYYFAFMR